MSEMIHCFACGYKIHSSAATCPGCGAQQTQFKSSEEKKSENDPDNTKSETFGFWCLVLGVAASLPSCSMSAFKSKDFKFIIIFSIIAMLIQITYIRSFKQGRTMPYLGLILSTMGLLAGLSYIL